MDTRFRRLFRNLTSTFSGKALQPDFSGPGQLPSPWEVWTLLALIRYRRRLTSLKSIFFTQLLGQTSLMITEDTVGRLDRLASFGLLPGTRWWEYRLWGSHISFRHRRTGEEIECRSANPMDPHFFNEYVKTTKRSVECRWRKFHLAEYSIDQSLHDLVEAGVLVSSSPGVQDIRLSPDTLRHETVLQHFGRRWRQRSQRAALALMIGDWITLAELIGEQMRSPAEECRRLRASHLRAVLDRPSSCAVGALSALADLDVPDLPDYFKRALVGEIATPTVALDLIRKRNDVRLCSTVFDVMTKASSPPWERVKAADFLLRNNYQHQECLKVLSASIDGSCAEAALVALEHEPILTRLILEKGLQIPAARAEAAAILGLLDSTWSRQTLSSRLAESDDPELTAECRVALKNSSDPEARRRAEEWETSHLGRVEAEPSFEASRVDHWMRKLHERVIPLRGQLRE